MPQTKLTALLEIRPDNISQLVAQIDRELSRATPTINVKLANAGNITSTSSQLTGLNTNLTSVTRNFDNAGLSANRFGQLVGLAGQRFAAFSIGAGAIVTAAAAIREGTVHAIEFDREMVRLGQVSGDTSRQISEVKNEITRLATSFGASSTDLAKSAVTLRQAGFAISDVKLALDALAKTSLSANFDNLQSTTEGAIAIMAQFKVQAKDLSTALGSVNQVAADYAVEASDLITGVKKSGAAFAQTGGQLNELLALFTAVRSTTRESAEEIGTGLRTIFTRLQRPETVEALKAIQVELRYTAAEAERLGNTKLANQFVGNFEAIRRISAGLANVPATDTRFAQVQEALGGYRQTSRTSPLINNFDIAQQALNSAQVGNVSLTVAADKAQEALSVKIARVREEYLALAREITDSKGFRAFAEGALYAASSIAEITKELGFLAPLLSGLALKGLFTGIGSFVGGIERAPTSPGSLVRGRKFATGGMVTGPEGIDVIPANLTRGEYVIRKEAAQQIGYGTLDHMNKGGRIGYAGGGIARFGYSRQEHSDIANLIKNVRRSEDEQDTEALIRDKFKSIGRKFDVDFSKAYEPDFLLHSIPPGPVMASAISNATGSMGLASPQGALGSYDYKSGLLYINSLGKNKGFTALHELGHGVEGSLDTDAFSLLASHVRPDAANRVAASVYSKNYINSPQEILADLFASGTMDFPNSTTESTNLWDIPGMTKHPRIFDRTDRTELAFNAMIDRARKNFGKFDGRAKYASGGLIGYPHVFSAQHKSFLNAIRKSDPRSIYTESSDNGGILGSLLNGALSNVHDDAPRLILSDYLEENGYEGNSLLGRLRSRGGAGALFNFARKQPNARNLLTSNYADWLENMGDPTHNLVRNALQQQIKFDAFDTNNLIGFNGGHLADYTQNPFRLTQGSTDYHYSESGRLLGPIDYSHNSLDVGDYESRNSNLIRNGQRILLAKESLDPNKVNTVLTEQVENSSLKNDIFRNTNMVFESIFDKETFSKILNEYSKGNTFLSKRVKQFKVGAGFAVGGRINGPEGRDVIPAALTNGEFVINNGAASRIGYGKLDYMNKYGKVPGFALGGRVGFADGGRTEERTLADVLQATLRSGKVGDRAQKVYDDALTALAGLGKEFTETTKILVKLNSKGNVTSFAGFPSVAPNQLNIRQAFGLPPEGEFTIPPTLTNTTGVSGRRISRKKELNRFKKLQAAYEADLRGGDSISDADFEEFKRLKTSFSGKPTVSIDSIKSDMEAAKATPRRKQSSLLPKPSEEEEAARIAIKEAEENARELAGNVEQRARDKAYGFKLNPVLNEQFPLHGYAATIKPPTPPIVVARQPSGPQFRSENPEFTHHYIGQGSGFELSNHPDYAFGGLGNLIAGRNILQAQDEERRKFIQGQQYKAGVARVQDQLADRNSVILKAQRAGQGALSESETREQAVRAGATYSPTLVLSTSRSADVRAKAEEVAERIRLRKQQERDAAVFSALDAEKDIADKVKQRTARRNIQGPSQTPLTVDERLLRLGDTTRDFSAYTSFYQSRFDRQKAEQTQQNALKQKFGVESLQTNFQYAVADKLNEAAKGTGIDSGFFLPSVGKNVNRSLLESVKRQVKSSGVPKEQINSVAEGISDQIIAGNRQVTIGKNGQLFDAQLFAGLAAQGKDPRGGGRLSKFTGISPEASDRIQRGLGLAALTGGSLLADKLRPEESPEVVAQLSQRSQNSYVNRNAASSGLQFAITGGLAGSAFGPAGAGVGAAGGFILGFVSSIKEAEQEIRRAKIGNALEELGSRISDIVSGREGFNGLAAAQSVSQIKEIRSTSFDKAKADSSGLFGFDSEQFSAQLKTDFRKNLGPNVGGFNQVLNKFAEQLGKNGEITGKSIDDVANIIQNGGGGLNRELLSVIAQLKSTNIGEEAKRYAEVAFSVQTAEKIRKAGEASQQASERAVLAFTHIAEGVENAYSVFEKFSSRFGELAQRIGGEPGVFQFDRKDKLDFGTLNRDDFRKELQGITGGLGESGNRLFNTASAVSDIKSVSAQALGSILSRPTSENRDLAVEFSAAVKAALGGGPFTSEFHQSLGAVSDTLGTKKIEELQKLLRGGLVDNLVKEITAPLDVVQQATEKLRDIQLSGSNRLLGGFAEVNVATRRQDENLNARDVALEAAGRGRGDVGAFASDFVRSRIQNRLLETTGVAPNQAFDPRAIGQKLQDTYNDIDRAEENLSKLQESTQGRGAEFGEAAKGVADLRDRASQLSKALQNLTNVSTAQADRQSRLNFGQSFLNAAPAERLELTRGLQLAAQGFVNGAKTLSEEELKLAVNVAGQTGAARFTGLPGAPTGEAIREKLLGEAFGGDFGLSEGGKKELEDAARAFKELASAQGSNIDKMIQSLERLQRELIQKIGEFITKDATASTRAEVAKKEEKLGTLGAAGEQRKFLEGFGINNDNFSTVKASLPILQGLSQRRQLLSEVVKPFDQFDSSSIIEKNLRNFGPTRDSSNAIFKDIKEQAPFLNINRDDVLKGLEVGKEKFGNPKGIGKDEVEDIQRKRVTEAISVALQSAKEREVTDKVLKDIPVDQKNLLQGGIPGLNLDNLILNFDKIKKAFDQFGTGEGKVNFDTIFKDIDDTKAGYEAVKAKLKALQDSLGEKSVPPEALLIGGLGAGLPVQRAFGGDIFKPIGSDVIPAMLSNGEFVVNAKSASANAALLEEINNSRTPISPFDAMRKDMEDGKNPLSIMKRQWMRANGGQIYRANGGVVYRANGGLSLNELDSRIRFKRALAKAQGKELTPEDEKRISDEYSEEVARLENRGRQQEAQVPGLGTLRPEPDLPGIRNSDKRTDTNLEGLIRADAGHSGQAKRDALIPNIGFNGLAEKFAQSDPTGDVAAALFAQRRGTSPRDALAFQQRREVASFQRRSDANLVDGGAFIGQRRAGFDIGNRIRSNDADIRDLYRQRVDALSPTRELAQQGLEGLVAPQRLQVGQEGAPVGGLNNPERIPRPREIPAELGGGVLSRPNERAGAAGGAGFGISPDAVTAMQQLSKSLNDSTPALVQSLTGFNQSSQQLTEALKAFPNKISIEGKQQVEVIINGAEAFAGIQPALTKLVEEKTSQAIENLVRDKFPDAGVA